jgi:hypothetical protein
MLPPYHHILVRIERGSVSRRAKPRSRATPQMKFRVGPVSTLVRVRTDHAPLLEHLDAFFDQVFEVNK